MTKLNQFELRDYWERLSWVLAYYWDGDLAEIAKAIKTTKPSVERELADLTAPPAPSFAKAVARAAAVDWDWLSGGADAIPKLRESKLPAYCYIGCQTSAPDELVGSVYAYLCVDRSFVARNLQRISEVAASQSDNLQYHVFMDYDVTFTDDLEYEGLEPAVAETLSKLVESVDVSCDWFLMPPGWSPTDGAQPKAERLAVSHLYADDTGIFFEGLPKHASQTADTQRLTRMQLRWLANCLKDRDTGAQSLTAALPVKPSLVGV